MSGGIKYSSKFNDQYACYTGTDLTDRNDLNAILKIHNIKKPNHEHLSNITIFGNYDSLKKGAARVAAERVKNSRMSTREEKPLLASTSNIGGRFTVTLSSKYELLPETLNGKIAFKQDDGELKKSIYSTANGKFWLSSECENALNFNSEQQEAIAKFYNPFDLISGPPSVKEKLLSFFSSNYAQVDDEDATTLKPRYYKLVRDEGDGNTVIKAYDMNNKKNSYVLTSSNNLWDTININEGSDTITLKAR